MRSENIDWFCELRADSGKTLNSHKTNNIFATNSWREWRSSKPRFPERKFVPVEMGSIMDIIGSGEIGGKAKGFFRAREILTSDAVNASYPREARLIRFPESFSIGTDVYENFVGSNALHDVILRCKRCEEESDYERLKQSFLLGTFPPSIVRDLSKLLKKLTYPLAVRSSSVLEDQPGTSFAGKYDTVFISNRGTLGERTEQLLTAIKDVYASTHNPSAIQYRAKHHLLDEDERMSILLQEAVGREYEGYFMPLMAGVGFSQNGYTWNKEIKREDGLVRLVFGLGTRAVGRGYARLFVPKKPMLRPEGTDVREIDKFSQATIDALDLNLNRTVSFHFSKVVKNGLECYPRAERLFSLREGNHLYIPVTNMWNPEHKPVLTFDDVLINPWCGLYLPSVMDAIFKSLEQGFGCPVDVEFAVRVDDNIENAYLYLLQARALSQRSFMASHPVPKDIPEPDKLFSAVKNIPSAVIHNIEYIVYVDSFQYDQWPMNDRHEVARVIGRINRILEGKTFMLMGPGRWGSAKVELGVPTKYSEISNCAMLVEIARRTENYVPEVSFGTHFFQDLIEDCIVYMSLYPDDPGIVFNEEFLKRQNLFRQLLPDDYHSPYESLIRVVSVPQVSQGRFATAVLNGDTEEALIYLK